MADDTSKDLASVVDEAARAFATDPSYLLDMARQGAAARARREAKLAATRSFPIARVTRVSALLAA